MLISVVIPSFNHSKYIIDAVDSVLKQTYENLELIIVDDGSTDNSVELLSMINDVRVKIFTQKNQGAHAAINRGLELSAGDYISILNSDDVFEETRFQECCKFIDKNGIDFVSTWINVIDEGGKKIGLKKAWKNMRPQWTMSNNKKGYWDFDDVKLNSISSNFVSTTSNMFFTRKVFEKIGGMKNLRFAHDWDYLLRVASEFQIGVIEKPLLNYRIHSSNTIHSNKKWMLFEVMWVIANHIKNFKNEIYVSAEKDEAMEKIKLLNNSINFQGNDRVFWILRDFIENNKDVNFSDMLLTDVDIRNVFINMIK